MGLIDKQAAIDAVEESRRLNHHQDGKEACAHEYEHRHFLKILRELPSAQPEEVIAVTWINKPKQKEEREEHMEETQKIPTQTVRCVGENVYTATVKPVTVATPEPDQKVKADAGKPRLTLVPMQILWDIAAVREFGNTKYKGSDNWKMVEAERFREAAFRHFLKYIDDPGGVDEESGLPHRWHLECNLAFLAELEKHNADRGGFGSTGR